MHGKQRTISKNQTLSRGYAVFRRCVIYYIFAFTPVQFTLYDVRYNNRGSERERCNSTKRTAGLSKEPEKRITAAP